MCKALSWVHVGNKYCVPLPPHTSPQGPEPLREGRVLDLFPRANQAQPLQAHSYHCRNGNALSLGLEMGQSGQSLGPREDRAARRLKEQRLRVRQHF